MNFKYIKPLKHILFLYIAISILPACAPHSVETSEEDKDLLVKNLSDLGQELRNVSEVMFKNRTDSLFAKKILHAFPAQYWQDKGLKTIKDQFLQQLLEKGNSIPFTLESKNHILSIKESLQTQEDWQEMSTIADFAVFSHDLKEAYVFVSEGKFKQNDVQNIIPKYYSFWHYNGKTWQEITPDISLPDLKDIFDKGDMVNLFIQNTFDLVLKASVKYPEYIIATLPQKLIHQIKMDKEYYLQWTGKNFIWQSVSDLAISK